VVLIFVLLLLIFLAGFLGLDFYTTATASQDLYIATVQDNQVFMSGDGARVVLVLGIIFCEFVIIFLSVFDRILDTIKMLIRPILTTVPLATFLYSTYQTFVPIIRNLIPVQGGDPIKIADVVRDPAFDSRVLITIGAMLFYLAIAKVFGGSDAELKKLRAENQRLKKKQG
jgi:hypothetical protein